MESTSGPAGDPARAEGASARPPEYSEPFAAGYGPPIAPTAPPPYATGAPAAYGPSSAVGSAESARNVAMLAHLSAFVGFIGVPMLVGPLVVWLAKREEHPYIDDQGREALNFNLSVLIYAVVGSLIAAFVTIVTFFLALIVIIPLAFAAVIGWVVLVIVAAVKSSRGEPYRYPLTIRMIH